MTLAGLLSVSWDGIWPGGLGECAGLIPNLGHNPWVCFNGYANAFKET